MQVVGGAARFQFGVNKAAQAGGDGGEFRREHFRIADQRRVSFQPLRVGRHVLLDVFASHFLFAFEQELDVDGQLAFGLQESLHRFEQKIGLPFVIDGAAGIEVVIADSRLEGRRHPFLEGIRRLHIVVPVKQQCRLAGRL